MKRTLSLILRAGVTLGCLAYALWGMDFSKLLTAVGMFSLPAVIACAGLTLVILVPAAWRLRFLMQDRVSLATTWRAVLLGLAFNNVLPARLGEMAKAFYLRRTCEVSLAQALEAVFWERFFDLNALLAVGVLMAVALDQPMVLYPLLAVVGAIWLMLLLVRWQPNVVLALAARAPYQKARLIVDEVVRLLKDKFNAPFLFRLAALTLVVWCGYFGLCALGLFWMAGIPFSPVLALTVFAVATLGVALPAAPGGMGVYEAAFVLSLGWFGMDRERAFAVGLTIHMLQYLPVTFVGLWVMATSRLSIKALRRAEGDSSWSCPR